MLQIPTREICSIHLGYGLLASSFLLQDNLSGRLKWWPLQMTLKMLYHGGFLLSNHFFHLDCFLLPHFLLQRCFGQRFRKQFHHSSELGLWLILPTGRNPFLSLLGLWYEGILLEGLPLTWISFQVRSWFRCFSMCSEEKWRHKKEKREKKWDYNNSKTETISPVLLATDSRKWCKHTWQKRKGKEKDDKEINFARMFYIWLLSRQPQSESNSRDDLIPHILSRCVSISSYFQHLHVKERVHNPSVIRWGIAKT